MKQIGQKDRFDLFQTGLHPWMHDNVKTIWIQTGMIIQRKSDFDKLNFLLHLVEKVPFVWK